jgi:hypothetical protein
MITFNAMQNRTWLKGLTLECPFGNALANCPMEELRNIPFVECVKKINDLDGERVGNLIEHHIKCLSKRAGD